MAEIVTGESYLDVSILSDELNAVVKTPDEASKTAYYALGHWVSWNCTLILLSQVFKGKFDHLHDGDDESSKSDTAHVVSEDPSPCDSHSTLALIV